MYPNSPLFGCWGKCLPHTSIDPEIGLTNPAIVLRSVVFPIPDIPVKTIISPGYALNSPISIRMFLGSYPIVTF
tara:strand:- start:4357 stop:4578 length:222 start_codon:yes stop_codon:yes gene_type:complete